MNNLLITGASSDIGCELIRYLDDKDLTVYAHFNKSNGKIESLQKELKKNEEGKPILIYKTHTDGKGLVSLYGKSLRDSVLERDKISAESFKYLMEKTKKLKF